MESILNPSRRSSLDARDIRIVEHRVDAHKVSEQAYEMNSVVLCEPLRALKQRIALKHEGDPTWFPEWQFLARKGTETATGEASPMEFLPLEFSWSFPLQDPLSDEVRGIPDARLFEQGSRTTVSATPYPERTIERALEGAAEIHVWTLGGSVGLTDYKGPREDDIFEGYFKLYWPLLQDKSWLNAASHRDMTAADTQQLEAIRTYLHYLDVRTAKINAELAALATSPTPVAPALVALHALRCELAPHESFARGLLEIKFYEMTPNEAIPFIRFFPSKDRGAPLVQTGVRGTPGFLDRSLLELFMKDEPEERGASAILLKSPVSHRDAPASTAWTITIYEGGRATISLRGPSKDAPLTRSVVVAAFDQLRGVLAQTPWRGEEEPTRVSELIANYECTSRNASGKPSYSELRKRVDVISPFFMVDPPDDSGKLKLRYKSVSDYVYKTDPVSLFITRIVVSEKLVVLRQGSGAVLEERSRPLVEGLLARQFGLSKQDTQEALDTWGKEVNEEGAEEKTRRLELAQTWGIPVVIDVQYPQYVFNLAPTKSLVDLGRILDLLSLLVSKSSEELNVESAAAAVAAVAPVAAETAAAAAAAATAATVPVAAVEAGEEEEEEEEEAYDPMLAAMLDDQEEAVPAAVAAEGTAVAAEGTAVAAEGTAVAAEGTAAVPKVLDRVEAIGKSTLLNRLRQADPELFEHPAKAKTGYTSACQTPARRLPFLMRPDTYRAAREFYGTTVNWVETPLSAEDNRAVNAAASAPDTREGATTSAIVALELRALRLGFPLKPGKAGLSSITQTKSDATEQQKQDIRDAKVAQESKTLMVVVRAGTKSDAPNYYICGDLWCLYDDLPVDPRAFAADSFAGKPKKPNTCPKCHGVVIKDETKPVVGETVWVREGRDQKGNVIPSQPYAGYQDKILKPDPSDGNKGYVAPCCFKTPTSLSPPLLAKPIPAPLVALPDAQQQQVVEEVVPDVPRAVDANTARPFSPKTLGGTINHWFIPGQNIKGRGTQKWMNLYKGDVAVPPPSVNTLLGQTPDTFLSKAPSHSGGTANSYLVTPGSAFLRYSLGVSPSEPGHNLVALLAFAIYASKYHDTRNDALSIQPVDAIKNLICESSPGRPPSSTPSLGDTGHMIHAFEQANYGTLLHEFSTPGSPWTPEDTAGFNPAWLRRVGFTTTDAKQTPYLKNLYKAWKNFENYVQNATEPKALSTWEGLLATPGLFTRTGVLLVRIRFPKNRSDPATIQCPRYGIAPIHQVSPPPFLFVVEDEESGRFDPLVLYNGIDKERHVYGIVHPETDAFKTLPASLQTPLRGFLQEYASPNGEGCGRRDPPLHPWMPVRSSYGIPAISDLVAFSKDKTKGLEIKLLLRDITNRLVGVILKEKSDKSDPPTLVYIPALDDGTLLLEFPTVRGEEGIPEPSFDKCIEFLMGKQHKVISENKLAGAFPGLKPVHLVKDKEMYVGLELACGAEIKIEPTKAVDTKGKAQARFKEFVAAAAATEAAAAAAARTGLESYKSAHPWDFNAKTLQKTGVGTIGVTEEEQLEDAYQHLRISFSNWLFSDGRGAGVLEQIELLRQARKRLPLFELQKRLVILLTPIVANTERPWITTDGETTPSILRRDCLQIKTADKCVAGCVWASDACLIHTSATPRYVDPIRVMTARLADELVRTFGAAREILEQKDLPYLKSVGNEIVYSETGALFSRYGRGDDELYRKLGYTETPVSAFGRGLTYPEETSLAAEVKTKGARVAEVRGVAVAAELPADWAEKLQPRVFGAAAPDARTRFVQVLVELSGKSKADLDTKRGAPLTGTAADWRWLAEETHLQIITTREEAGRVEISGLLRGYEGAGASTFVILSPDGVPYASKTTGSMTLKAEELPTRVLEEMRRRGL